MSGSLMETPNLSHCNDLYSLNNAAHRQNAGGKRLSPPLILSNTWKPPATSSELLGSRPQQHNMAWSSQQAPALEPAPLKYSPVQLQPLSPWYPTRMQKVHIPRSPEVISTLPHNKKQPPGPRQATEQHPSSSPKHQPPLQQTS